MICPVCNKEAELFADIHPNGLIGCFCKNCLKGYITRNPEDGWCDIKITPEAIQDLKALHGVDLPPIIMEIAMADRRNGLGF